MKDCRKSSRDGRRRIARMIGLMDRQGTKGMAAVGEAGAASVGEEVVSEVVGAGSEEASGVAEEADMVVDGEDIQGLYCTSERGVLVSGW